AAARRRPGCRRAPPRRTAAVPPSATRRRRSAGTRRPRSDEEVRAYIRDVVVPLRETWVAEESRSGAIVGLMVLAGDLLSQLYLDPDWRGHGIGDRFVTLAKERSPRGLSLWTFQVNGPAHRFYERHGFVEAERTDGNGNEEREPDVRYVWRP
ncbi:N-acetyltransferase family protein, partial [Streptomyces sp. NRRL B-24085]|uniref:GNAT family N-acetyltransferase n=1 Tax=Streptomyces sp. NRRL B-24085 TaxID=1709476 RepID=UPI00358E0363